MQPIWVRLLSLILLAGLLAGCPKSNDPPIDDPAGLLTSSERQRVADFQRSLLQDQDIELKVVVLEEAAIDLDQLALDLFATYRVGQRTRAERGLLLAIDPAGRQVRLEVGYDLEGIYPDGFVGYIEAQQMVPFFQVGRIGAGIEATVELLIARALDGAESNGPADEGKAPRLPHLSGGAGARVAVELGGATPNKKPVTDSAPFAAADSPLEALNRYLGVLEGHVKDPDLGLYTPQTREFFRHWLVTDAQQDNELRELQRVIEQGRVAVAGDLAVLRFPIARRRNSPYLLRRGAAGWMLDFAAMSRLIGFNHRNQWFFRSTDHEFMFAFGDWQFDRHGFPHKGG